MKAQDDNADRITTTKRWMPAPEDEENHVNTDLFSIMHDNLGRFDGPAKVQSHTPLQFSEVYSVGVRTSFRPPETKHGTSVPVSTDVYRTESGFQPRQYFRQRPPSIWVGL